MAEPRNELGYGDVDARPDLSQAELAGGGESGGGTRPEPVETDHGEGPVGGQTDPAYRGGDNPNATRKGDGGDAQ